MFTIWALGLWLLPGLALALLFAYAEWTRPPRRPLRRRLLALGVHLPWVTPVLLLTWPLLLAVTLAELRRQSLRDRAPARPPAPPLTPELWHHGTDLARLLAAAAPHLSPRQRQLLAWAFCHVPAVLEHAPLPRVIEAGLRAVDAPDPDAVAQATRDAAAAYHRSLLLADLRPAAAARACLAALQGDPTTAANQAWVAAAWGPADRLAQLRALRDIAGDPFRPLAPRPLPPDVRELARAVDAGDSALLPLLADALDELGETAAADHCRQAGHSRGCHVLEWALARDDPGPPLPLGAPPAPG